MLSLSKQQRPDSNVSGTFFDRHLEVAAHSHRQKSLELRIYLPELDCTLTQFDKPGSRLRGCFAQRRNRHQAEDLKILEREDLLEDVIQLTWKKAMFALLLSQVHLEEAVEHTIRASCLRVEVARDLEPVDSMKDIEQLYGFARLVALQWPDEMPAHVPG